MTISGPTNDEHEIRTWAEAQKLSPFEQFPSRVDGEPVTLKLLPTSNFQNKDRPGLPKQNSGPNHLAPISWEHFFATLTVLGLTIIYATDGSGFNEILQIDENTPYQFT